MGRQKRAITAEQVDAAALALKGYTPEMIAAAQDSAARLVAGGAVLASIEANNTEVKDMESDNRAEVMAAVNAATEIENAVVEAAAEPKAKRERRVRGGIPVLPVVDIVSWGNSNAYVADYLANLTTTDPIPMADAAAIIGWSEGYLRWFLINDRNGNGMSAGELKEGVLTKGAVENICDRRRYVADNDAAVKLRNLSQARIDLAEKKAAAAIERAAKKEAKAAEKAAGTATGEGKAKTTAKVTAEYIVKAATAAASEMTEEQMAAIEAQFAAARAAKANGAEG
jgi:hypothetical protein